MHKIISALLAATASVTFVSSAQALNPRTWVSGTGVDQSGCGPIATPCRTLQYAHDNTSAGGEIDVKDSAGYGSLSITKAISVVGDGSLAGVLASPLANAISVSAGLSDLVVLRGLTIEGAGVGNNGIVFNSAGRLDITNCVIQNFVQRNSDPTSGNGILLQPTDGTPNVFISNTVASHNGFVGIYYLGSTSGSAATTSLVVDRSSAADNTYGIALSVGFGGGTTTLTIDLCAADLNSKAGFFFDGVGATLNISRSRASRNGTYGLQVLTGGAFSFGNNQFSSNGSGQTSGTIQPIALH